MKGWCLLHIFIVERERELHFMDVNGQVHTGNSIISNLHSNCSFRKCRDGSITLERAINCFVISTGTKGRCSVCYSNGHSYHDEQQHVELRKETKLLANRLPFDSKWRSGQFK